MPGSPTICDRLRELLDQHFGPQDYPALLQQVADFQAEQPLRGFRLLDASPVFANTTAKYLALLCGGAELTVSIPPELPHDPAVVDLLRRIGLPVVEGAAALDPTVTFDVVLDCAGLHAGVPSRFGYVELTASGGEAYRDAGRPVLLVDASNLKRIETALGTGDGFVRALAHLGHDELAGRHVVVFGGGKVGSGIARAATAADARVSVVDVPGTPIPAGCDLVPLSHPDRVRAVIREAWVIVTATGVPGALSGYTRDLAHSTALVANMGVADEFGPGLPADRVLNAKVPLNFVLAEPTRLRYLDPVLALHNACAVALVAGAQPNGPLAPPSSVEEPILAAARRGAIGPELADWPAADP